MSGLNIDTSDRKEQRNFGIVMAIAIVLVTLIHWLIRGHLAVWPFYIAGAFLALGLVAPRVLEPIFWAWMKLALGLNWVVTRLLLSIVFFLLIVPFRVGLGLFGDDPMQRSWDPDAESYWEEAEEQPTDPSRYTNMY
jgi:hypothetical protein